MLRDHDAQRYSAIHDDCRGDFTAEEIIRKSAWQRLLLDGTKRALREFRLQYFNDEELGSLTGAPTERLTELIHAEFINEIGSSDLTRDLFDHLAESWQAPVPATEVPVRNFGRDGIRSAAATLEASIKVAERDVEPSLRRRFIANSYMFAVHWAMVAAHVDSYIPYLLARDEVMDALITRGEYNGQYELNPDKLTVHPDDMCLMVRNGVYDRLPNGLHDIPSSPNFGAGCPILPVIPRIYHGLLTHKLGHRPII